jgi:hypothetical protein
MTSAVAVDVGIMNEQIILTIASRDEAELKFQRWCREGESNPQGTKYRRILSPLRLPVPPSRHFVEVLVSMAVSLLFHIGAHGNKYETV